MIKPEKFSVVFLFAWLALVFILYAGATFVLTSEFQAAKSNSIKKHEARLNPYEQERNRTKADVVYASPDQVPKEIQVSSGIYIDRIYDFSIRDSKWYVDFYIWFGWTGNQGDVGNEFQIIDGEILKKQEVKVINNQGNHYALYRVKAAITKFFDISRFPHDDHFLTIRVESTSRNYRQQYFVPNEAHSDVSSRVHIPGYKIYEKNIVMKYHSYKSGRGDPSYNGGDKETYSQLIYGIGIKRAGWGLFIKMFVGLFASVSVALLTFKINPSVGGPRISIGVGAFFAGIASTYVISTQIPASSVFSLTDHISAISLATIFLILVSSIISIATYERFGHEDLLLRLDRWAFLMILVLYTVLIGSISVTAIL